jgi:hypothetical protein
VEPGLKHEFRVIEDSQVVEEMYVQYCEEDIIRLSVGGPLGGSRV